MSKIKIIQVKGKTPEERKELIEKVQNLNENITCKGSVYFEEFKQQGYPLEDKVIYGADIYFLEGQTPIKEYSDIKKASEDIKFGIVKEGETIKVDEREKFIPATEPQKATLKKMEWNGDYKKLSKSQATKIISDRIEELNRMNNTF